MSVRRTATAAARWGGWVGLACGVVYAVGGFIVDFRTVGLNAGTVLAFLALVGMPALFGAVGYVLGALVGLVRRVGRGR